MNKISRRTSLGVIAGACTAPMGLKAQANLDRIRFATQWVWQSDHAIWTIAEQRGYFTSENLSVSVDRGYGSADNMTKIAAGALDVGIVDINLLPKFNHDNPNNQLISFMVIFDAAPSAIMFLKSSGIKKPKDVEGKRVAVTDADATTLLFPIIAEKNGIDTSKIEFKSVNSALRDTMVLQGSADASLGYITTAVVNWQANGTPKDQIGYFQYNQLGLDLYSLGLVCRKDFAKAHPEAIKGFVRAAIRATRDMLADMNAAVASVKKRDPLINDSVELIRLELTRDISLLTPNVKKEGISAVDRARFEGTTGQVARVMGVPPVKMETIYTDDYLPPREARKII
jgi:NitT/TauT family transport system substrate-binding protein